MYKIRFHGRGGQGIKLAAHILARAAFLSGYQVQSFAVYGAERRGAPLTSFVRMDRKEILERGYIFDPGFVVCIDDTLELEEVVRGLSEDGKVLINTNKYPGRFSSTKQKVYTIDATKVALDTIGLPIPNTAILGAFAKIFGKIPPETLEKAVKKELEEEGKGELVEKNNRAVKVCYSKMRL
ncbi:MAG: 2-oxoacid:acceptor oxidoreductase family protein [archaeon]|nr:MAG: 2-oxoacid:acceptor oxidoreductase family protein [archaeon]